MINMDNKRHMEFDAGERLRSVRELYGLSQRALAKKAGVTNGMISMIEQNRNSPSLATFKKILDAIPISFAEFFSNDIDGSRQIVFRADELVEIGSSGFSFRQVGKNLQDKSMQILHERISPGADSGAEMLRHDSQEGGVVIKGRLELTVGGETHVLEPGDAYYFDSRIPHRFRNVGEEEVEMISTCTPPTL
ncbi:cupin domain-containing protein [Desulforhopalus singaporensis]|uniref:Transcriptional regulator, XRE family with cupin sensor n=1 Tax=Desulforhopalus singaporensis TaxID=91360 RepID=A0A1H0SFW5_9BACT|nr:cupin domain-containing protein [Desulforhopalus singaporensis]SDP40138.1 transcriptional regulator, XRE family with cupin sensor [Desulforhopalus singaporensis]